MIIATKLNKIIKAFMILVILFLSCMIDITPVSAVSIYVNTTNDEEINDTTCSLREAIEAARLHDDYYGCSHGETAWITLPAGIYTVDTGTLPSIDTAITVHGAGSLSTVIQASDCNPIEDSCSTTDRLFYVHNTGALTLEDLTIRNSYLDNMDGGAIYNYQGTLNIYNSVLTANRSTGGGAIYNEGTLYITESTFSSNMVGTNQDGGAIYNYNISQSAFIEKSTFSNNSAHYGGAIWNVGSGGVLEIENCTFSNNTAVGFGGGLVNNATAVLTNNTFSGNSAPIGAGVFVGVNKDLSLVNTIIANSLVGSDCANSGTISTNLNNLIEDGSCDATYSGDPSLSYLGNYGGSTQTHALNMDSTAIDTGSSESCPDTDQRGVERPQLSGCDIGAYEREPTTPTFLPLIMK